jgi:hypothetical protein
MIDFILRCGLAEGWPFFWFCLVVAGAAGLIGIAVLWLILRLFVRMDRQEQRQFEHRRGVHLANCACCGKEHARESSPFCSDNCARLNYEIPTPLPTTVELPFECDACGKRHEINRFFCACGYAQNCTLDFIGPDEGPTISTNNQETKKGHTP